MDIIQLVTEIPNMPALIEALINLRGKVIPVIDLNALRLKNEVFQYINEKEIAL